MNDKALLVFLLLISCSCAPASADPRGIADAAQHLPEWKNLSQGCQEIASQSILASARTNDLSADTLVKDLQLLLEANARQRNTERDWLIAKCITLMQRRQDPGFAQPLRRVVVDGSHLTPDTRSRAFLAYYSITKDQALAEVYLDGADDALRAAALQALAFNGDEPKVDAALARVSAKRLDYTGTRTAMAISDVKRWKELREELRRSETIALKLAVVLARLPQLFTISSAPMGIGISEDASAQYLMKTLKAANKDDAQQVKDTLVRYAKDNPAKKTMIDSLLQELSARAE